MKTRNLFLLFVLFLSVSCLMAQVPANKEGMPEPTAHSQHRWTAGTSYLCFLNFGEEKTNTRHYEIHVKYRLSDRDFIGIKAATWKLFAPMGIQLWDPQFMDEAEFYEGRIRETGIGATYQHFWWKGFFSSVEVLPLFKTYLDKENQEAGKGFKLYTSFHLGYRINLFNKRLFLEPQIHSNYWPIDTQTPQAFKEADQKWKNYFLFEPNLYIGVRF